MIQSWSVHSIHVKLLRGLLIVVQAIVWLKDGLTFLLLNHLLFIVNSKDLCFLSCRFKSLFLFRNIVLKIMDLFILIGLNFIKVNEEQLMHEVVNLFIDIHVGVLSWAIIHPPFINPLIDIVLVHIRVPLLYETHINAFPEFLHNVTNRLSFYLFPCCNHFFFEICK